MSKTTIKMHKKSDGTVWLGKDGKKVDSVTINKDKDLEIKVSSDFSSAAQITGLTLYNTDGDHGKGTSIGTWLRTAPSTQPSAAVDVSIDSNGVLVADSNTGTEDDDFFFSATCTDNGTAYSTDPELIVKKKTT